MKKIVNVPRPDGPIPGAKDGCPECGAGPGVPHTNDCPWMLWADNDVERYVTLMAEDERA